METEPPFKQGRHQEHMSVETYQNCYLSYLLFGGLCTGGPYRTMLASIYQIGRLLRTIVTRLAPQVHLEAGRYKSTIMCSVEAPERTQSLHLKDASQDP